MNTLTAMPPDSQQRLVSRRELEARAIQEAMGHKNLETTMGYLHAEALSVASP